MYSNCKYTIQGKFLCKRFNKIENFTNDDNNLITTIITTCPRLCMKKIDLIKTTIDSLKKVDIFYKNPIVICFDGGPINKDIKLNEKCSEKLTDERLKEYKEI